MNSEEIVKRYASLKLSDSNEAETRKKVIDRVIEDVLGWSDEDISYEERVTEDGSSKYADYIIRTADTAILIEAKRAGAAFELSSSKKKQKLAGRFLEGETGKAIRQARDYCRIKNIPFAVITNGSQWIIFPAVRTDQISFAESFAVVFDSLSHVLGEENPHFQSLLSRDGVIEGSLAIELLGRAKDQFEERRLNRFTKARQQRPENPVYPLIENEIIAAFSDSIVESDDALLEKCYVKNADRKKFDSRIQMHLGKRDPLFSSQPKRPMRRREANVLKDTMGAASKRPRPVAIVILGSVGTGKTTFLHFTRRVAARKYFEKPASGDYPHWIDIDFRDYPQNIKPIEFIYNAAHAYINEDPYFSDYNRCIRSAYSDEISALRRGPMHLVSQDEEGFKKLVSERLMEDYGKVYPYVEKLLQYAAGHAPIFLVIDNVDQFESDSLQSEIFSCAIAMASKLGLNLIISMRESTYVKHRNSPTFDAFDFDPLHIEPPEIPAVLSRRFFLSGQMLKDKPGSFTALNGARMEVADLSVFIDIVKGSVLGTEVGDRIDVLANHDVRLALRMTREFLSRGYTDAAKALQVHKKEGRYTLPKHEAFRSILLGNHSVYSEEYSVIGNPFDSRLGRSSGECLRLFVLNALVNQSSANSASSMSGVDIRDNLNSIGFSESDALDVLIDLCRLRFAHTKSHGDASIASGYYASRLGGHVVRSLLCDFTFVENTMFDTFISSKDVWEVLRTLTNEIDQERDTITRVDLRVQRALAFYEHVEEQYSIIVTEAKKRNLEDIWLSNPLDEGKAILQAHLAKAKESVRKNYGRRNTT